MFGRASGRRPHTEKEILMYEMYSKYYDSLNMNYDFCLPYIDNVLKSIISPKKLIEFGCGTGNLLNYFKNRIEVYGVDLSEDMLNKARSKISNGHFYLHDMVDFSCEDKFDISLCLFDSVNHILDYSRWDSFFKNVGKSLTDQGVFILDANTTKRLMMISKKPPMIEVFDNNYFYMKLNKKNEKNFVFDVRVLKNIGNELYREEKEEIEETTESGEVILKSLGKYFKKIDVYNDKKIKIEKGEYSTNEESRWFYICREAIQ